MRVHRVSNRRASKGGKHVTHLGQLELLQVQLLHDAVAQDIGGGKQPAPPAGLLARDRVSLEVELVVENMRVDDTGITRREGSLEVGVDEDRARELYLVALCHLVFPASDVGKRYAAVLGHWLPCRRGRATDAQLRDLL